MPYGLMSLVANGAENNYIHRNISLDYITYGPAQLSSSILITREADIFLPEYVKFNFTQPDPGQPVSLSMLKAQLSKLTVCMEIGGGEILHLPLALLVNLIEPEIIDSSIYVKLHFDKIFGPINLIGLGQHEVGFKIILNQPTINQVEFITNWEVNGILTYLDSSERSILATAPYESFVQQIYQMDVNVSNTNPAQTASEFSILVPFDSPHKGLFIECDNPNTICEINLYLNDMARFKMDLFLIKTKCKIISERVLWFPFNYNAEMLSKHPESLQGSTNFSIIDAVRLEVKFNPNTPTNRIGVFGLGSNVYRQMSGVGGLVFHVSCSAYSVRDLQTDYNLLPISSARMYKISKIAFKLQGFKLITNPNYNFCPISYEDIPIGTQYTSCSACKNNYCVDTLTMWLNKKQPEHQVCPTCKSKWNNWNSYINQLESIPNFNNPHTEPEVKPANTNFNLVNKNTNNQEIVV